MQVMYRILYSILLYGVYSKYVWMMCIFVSDCDQTVLVFAGRQKRKKTTGN